MTETVGSSTKLQTIADWSAGLASASSMDSVSAWGSATGFSILVAMTHVDTAMLIAIEPGD
jgi:hypothetical protein